MSAGGFAEIGQFTLQPQHPKARLKGELNFLIKPGYGVDASFGL